MVIVHKKTCLSLLLAGLAALPATAQKKKFTIAEATNGMATTLALKSLSQPTWRPGTHQLYHVAKGSGNEYLVRVSFPGGKADTIENLAGINRSVRGEQEMEAIPKMEWANKQDLFLYNGADLNLGTATGNSMVWQHYISLPENAANVKIDKSRQIAYTVDNNLWMVSKDKRMVQVTDEGNKNIISGQSVHRNEFGIDGGIFFSPKGAYLAYYQMDQTMMKDYPIVKWGDVPAVADIIKYPMAGGTSHQVSLHVYNPATKETVILQTGKPLDHYLTSVTWSPDERHIYIAILNREQNHMWLNQYDTRTGKKLKTLFEETSSKYVEPQHPLSFLPNDNEHFIWWSQKDGYQHLYLYNTAGQELQSLTPGSYDVNELLRFEEATNSMLITSAKESPMEKHIYRVGLMGGIQRIDREAGVHTAVASEDGAYVFDTYTSSTKPKVCAILSSNGDYRKVLLDAANTLKDYDRAEVRNVRLKADDGTPLYGKIILPPNFDSTRKYPVIVYLYNGPHVQLVRNTFPESGNLWYEYMAQRGYIVFTMDGRGSSNRGRKFEQVVFRRLGTVEMEDQLCGVAYLKSLPYVDDNRLGIHGWSFGGFMTTSFMLRNPRVFKVGVGGGPVIDWSMYEIMYGERYMDTPQENPQGYAESNLLTKVKNLEGKLLLIHGTDDDVVVWQHSINLIKKSVDEGVQIDYFVYPGHPHNVRGKDRVHLMQKITDYFDTYLK